jgi:hypothetical protein
MAAMTAAMSGDRCHDISVEQQWRCPSGDLGRHEGGGGYCPVRLQRSDETPAVALVCEWRPRTAERKRAPATFATASRRKRHGGAAAHAAWSGHRHQAIPALLANRKAAELRLPTDRAEGRHDDRKKRSDHDHTLAKIPKRLKREL